MPIPFIVPIAAAAAAGTVGFLIGREMASSPEEVSVSDLGGHAGLPGMTEAEALKILELEAGATPDEIWRPTTALRTASAPTRAGRTILSNWSATLRPCCLWGKGRLTMLGPACCTGAERWTREREVKGRRQNMSLTSPGLSALTIERRAQPIVQSHPDLLSFRRRGRIRGPQASGIRRMPTVGRAYILPIRPRI